MDPLDAAKEQAAQEVQQEAQNATPQTNEEALLMQIANSLATLNQTNENLLRIQARHVTSSAMSLDPKDKVYTQSYTATVSGSLNQLHADESRATWVAQAGPQALRPDGLTDAEFKELFPDGQVVIDQVVVSSIDNKYPTALGITLTGAKGLLRTESLGTQQKHHLTIGPNMSVHTPQVLHASGGDAAEKFLRSEYAAYTPHNIEDLGVAKTTKDSNIMLLASDHPALTTALRWMRTRGLDPKTGALVDRNAHAEGQEDAEILSRNIAMATPANPFVHIDREIALAAITKAKQDLSAAIKVEKLSDLVEVSVTRDSAWNSADELTPLPADEALAVQKIASAATQGVRAPATISGPLTLNGMQNGAKATAAPASMSLENAVSDVLLNKPAALTVKFTFVFRSPLSS